MSDRNSARTMAFVLLVLTLFCAWMQAAAESEPALRFETEKINVPVQKTVKVMPMPENIENLKALKFNWTSADEQIATVYNGTIKGISPGETVITCSAELADGKQISCALNASVVIPVRTIRIGTKANTSVRVGEKLAIDYTVLPANATVKSLTWESSDTNIATVDNDGIVTAVSAGKVIITASSNDGSREIARVTLYIPSLLCETDHLELTNPEGASFDVDYFGMDWENDITVVTDKKLFSYQTEKTGSKVTIHVDGETAGTGRIEIRNRKDPAAKVFVNINVSQEAIPLSKEVYIDKVIWRNDQGSVTIRNNTGENIHEVKMVAKYYDQSGNLMYMTDGGCESVGGEFCYYGNKNIDIRKESALNWDIKTTHFNGSSWIEIAVYRYGKENGTTVCIPENGFHWFSSKTQSYINAPEMMNINCYPGQETMDRAELLNPGFVSEHAVEGWLASHFGYHSAGIHIKGVEDSSAADKAGLQANDLIIAVDGVQYADDACILEKGKEKMLDGNSITVTIERYGQEGTIDLVFAPVASDQDEQ